MTSDFYLHGHFPGRCLCSPPEERRSLIPPSNPGRQRQPLAQQPKGSSASGSTTTTTVGATEPTPQRFCCSQQQSTSVAPQRLCCSQQQLKRSDAATFQTSTTRYWRQYPHRHRQRGNGWRPAHCNTTTDASVTCGRHEHRKR